MQIKDAIKNLNYQSESDCLWAYNEQEDIKEMTCDTVCSTTSTVCNCIEVDYQELSEHMINTQPQSSEYSTLFNILSNNLTDIKAFKVSPSSVENYNLDIFIGGFDESNKLIIINTSGVET
jgi:hypothetical protein